MASGQSLAPIGVALPPPLSTNIPDDVLFTTEKGFKGKDSGRSGKKGGTTPSNKKIMAKTKKLEEDS